MLLKIAWAVWLAVCAVEIRGKGDDTLKGDAKKAQAKVELKDILTKLNVTGFYLEIALAAEDALIEALVLLGTKSGFFANSLGKLLDSLVTSLPSG